MAIFKKNDPPAQPQPQASPAQKTRERPGPAPRGAASDGAMSLIGAGMLVVGDIVTEGTVRVEGEVRGTIQAAKSVVLGQGGHVDGDIVTADAIIGGTISGTIVARHRLELQSTCTVNGQIQTRPEHLKLDEGARFTGQVHMLDDASPAAAGVEHRPRQEREEEVTNGHTTEVRRSREEVGASRDDASPQPVQPVN